MSARLGRVLRLQTVHESDITRLQSICSPPKGVKGQAHVYVFPRAGSDSLRVGLEEWQEPQGEVSVE